MPLRLTPAQRRGLRIPHIKRMVNQGYTIDQIQRRFMGTNLAVRRQDLIREVQPYRINIRNRPQLQQLNPNYLIPKRLHVTAHKFLTTNYKYEFHVSFYDEVSQQWKEIYQSVKSDYQMIKRDAEGSVLNWLRGRYGPANISNVKITMMGAYTRP